MSYHMTDEQAGLYSDLHKDVFGIRPRSVVKFASEESFFQCVEDMAVLLQNQIAEEEAREAAVWADWLATVKRTAMVTRAPEFTVMRWLFAAEDLNIMLLDDREQFCYNHGFAFKRAAAMMER